MKLLAVLALLVAVAAARREHHVNYCRGMSQARSDAATYRAGINAFLPIIIGHCDSANEALTAGKFFNNDCAVAFDQGYCYVQSKINEYNLEEKLYACGDDAAVDFTVTYMDMANALSAGSDVHKLGHLACEHAMPCFEHVVEQVAACAAADSNFYATALDKIVNLVVPLIEENAGDFEDFLACKMGADSDAMTLLSLVQDRITSFQDIVNLFNEYFSAEDQATLARDARASLYAFINKANDFCGAGCVRKTARYFKALFGATHDADTCPAIGLYCGGCQDNADGFIATGEPAVPCCTQDALDSISESIYELIADYSNIATDIEADLKAAAEAAGVSTAEYETMKEVGRQQLGCIEETYDTLSESDCA